MALLECGVRFFNTIVPFGSAFSTGVAVSIGAEVAIDCFFTNDVNVLIDVVFGSDDDVPFGDENSVPWNVEESLNPGLLKPGF